MILTDLGRAKWLTTNTCNNKQTGLLNGLYQIPATTNRQTCKMTYIKYLQQQTDRPAKWLISKTNSQIVPDGSTSRAREGL